MWNDRLGYVLTCPSNLGTGLRAGVHIRLPILSRVRPSRIVDSPSQTNGSSCARYVYHLGPSLQKDPGQPEAAEERHGRRGHGFHRRHRRRLQPRPSGQVRGNRLTGEVKTEMSCG